MSERASKRLEAMRANPRAGWTIDDVERLCRAYGIACAPARGGGSHYKVAHPTQNAILTIPYKRPVKPIYITRLIAFVDAVDTAT